MKFESLYKDRDKRIGLITSVLCLLSAFLFLLLNTFEIADPPPEEVPLNMTLPISALTFDNLKIENSGHSGGGKASNKKKAAKTATEAEKIITSKKDNDTKVTSGESSSTPSPNPEKEATTPVKKPNPFSGGDQGKQDTGGVGSGFGKDTGPEKGTSGTGKGKGESGGEFKRIRLNDPYIENIESDVNYKIQLRVKIDEDGNVIDAQNTSKTTTTSQIIINKVLSATISQVKYNKKPGSGIEEAYIIINIRAK
jgi:hypothetical protein